MGVVSLGCDGFFWLIGAFVFRGVHPVFLSAQLVWCPLPKLLPEFRFGLHTSWVLSLASGIQQV